MEASIPSRADFILLGDSLAAGWPPDLLADVLPGASFLNLGLPGDRVQTTQWRLQRLQASHLRPGYLLVMLGLNNLADGNPPEAIAAGLATVIGAACRVWRDPAVILLTVPRSRSIPEVRDSERARLNARLAADLVTPGRVHLLDADLTLASEQGAGVSRDSDGIHLSRHGYELLSQALGSTIASFEPRQDLP